jgi:hypothetical protein
MAHAYTITEKKKGGSSDYGRVYPVVDQSGCLGKCWKRKKENQIDKAYSDP